MYKTIGVFAHVDAGKTTFCEQLLYHMDSIKKRGRVDHHDAFLDHHDIERARGITIFAEQGRFHYKDSTYTLIDTPGHVDFAPEMERAIRVMDYAIVIISAVDGVEGHTETVWQLLRKHKVPTFFFINKIDREGADVESVMVEIQQLTEQALLLTHGIDEHVKEWVAEQDEELLESYLLGELADEQVLAVLSDMIEKRQLFICMAGSALKDEGVLPFFEMIDEFMTSHYEAEDEIRASVFKIRHDDQQRLTFCKLLSGKLNVRDELQFGEYIEKVTEIRLYNGTQFESVKEVQAGDICAVKGITRAQIGDIIGEYKQEVEPYQFIPTLQATVHYTNDLHVKEVLSMLRILEAEEPTLQVIWREQFQQIAVHIMGVIQLEVLTEILRQRFALDVTFGQPNILYTETIANSVIGYGHFEPLKHYAEVHLGMRPNKRGVGITFKNSCHADDLLVGQQRLIEQSIVERAHHGILTGYPLTDVEFTLLTGRAHQKHTEGGDFREATIRALRQGLEQAQNVLLEPYYFVKMKASVEHIGRMMTDIQQAYGTFDTPEMSEHLVVLHAHVPVATFMDYPTQFAAYTNGKGAISMYVAGYDYCHNTDEVLEKINYQKALDTEYPSSSVFCAKGKGYSVSWHEAKEAMHCPTAHETFFYRG